MMLVAGDHAQISDIAYERSEIRPTREIETIQSVSNCSFTGAKTRCGRTSAAYQRYKSIFYTT